MDESKDKIFGFLTSQGNFQKQAWFQIPSRTGNENNGLMLFGVALSSNWSASMVSTAA